MGTMPSRPRQGISSTALAIKYSKTNSQTSDVCLSREKESGFEATDRAIEIINSNNKTLTSQFVSIMHLVHLIRYNDFYARINYECVCVCVCMCSRPQAINII